MNEEIAAYVKRIVDAAPPLTEEQRTRIAMLLRPPGEYTPPPPPPLTPVHYDADGRALFTGPVHDDLTRHVAVTYVATTEYVPAAEAAGMVTVFGNPRDTVQYLVEHDDTLWLMPVQHVDDNGNAFPQRRGRQ